MSRAIVEQNIVTTEKETIKGFEVTYSHTAKMNESHPSFVSVNGSKQVGENYEGFSANKGNGQPFNINGTEDVEIITAVLTGMNEILNGEGE